MLAKLFLQILDLSLNASYVILAIVLARLLLKKAPKIFSYALWSVALVRLITPFSFKSIFSLMPRKTGDLSFVRVLEGESGEVVSAGNSYLPPIMPTSSVSPMQVLIGIGAVLWVLGIGLLLFYSIYSLLKLKKSLSNAILEEDNVFIVDKLDSPFVLGIFKPKIYLPASLSKEEKRYITLHEKIHIKRFDHIIKIVSYLVLCLHWFNPLVWLAFFLSGKDMEMSCDEKVIGKMGSEVKKPYSRSLLSLSTGKILVGPSPLAFGEGKTKKRVENVLNYKKPVFWLLILLLVFTLVLAIGLLSDPIDKSLILENEEDIKSIDMEEYRDGENLGFIEIKDKESLHIIYELIKKGQKTPYKSYNDVPGRDDYLRINLNGERLQRLFLYEDSNRYYLEAPYEGIYRIKKEVYDNLIKLFTSYVRIKDPILKGSDIEFDEYSIVWSSMSGQGSRKYYMNNKEYPLEDSSGVIFYTSGSLDQYSFYDGSITERKYEFISPDSIGGK